MEIQIKEIENNEISENSVNIIIEHHKGQNINKLQEYIKEYENQKVTVKHYDEIKQIDYKDIILFYSDKRYIYCKTKNDEYKVKKTLYEIESEDKDFVRISKSCIINVKHLDSFDLGMPGIIVAKMDNGVQEIVSRRKVKDVLKYIKERRI